MAINSSSGKQPVSLEKMELLATKIPLWEYVKQRVGHGIVKFSDEIKHEDFLRQQLGEGGDVTISLILLLSCRLNTNYLDPYIQTLPPHLRVTAQTREKDEIIKQLQDEILQLQSQAKQYEERHLADQALLLAAVKR